MTAYGVLAASLSLAGCVTTVEDLEGKQARASYELQRSPKSFAQCILETMGNLGSPKHYERADGTKVISYTVQDRIAAVYLVRAVTVDVHTLSSLIGFRLGTQACLK